VKWNRFEDFQLVSFDEEIIKKSIWVFPTASRNQIKGGTLAAGCDGGDWRPELYSRLLQNASRFSKYCSVTFEIRKGLDAVVIQCEKRNGKTFEQVNWPCYIFSIFVIPYKSGRGRHFLKWLIAAHYYWSNGDWEAEGIAGLTEAGMESTAAQNWRNREKWVI
jgi:hypothetical protein